MRAVLLVQEPILQAINRRFVFTFFDAFRQRGSAAAKFYKKHGGKSYGATFTIDGKHLGSFGFDMPEIYRALLKTKQQAPGVWALRPDEKKVLDAAASHPTDLDAQLAAARLHTELLEFGKAGSLLETFLQKTKNARDRAIARYWSAHHALNESDLEFHTYGRSRGGRSRAELRKVRAEIAAELGEATWSEHLPDDLRDDLGTDRIRLEVELRRGGGFYTGWQFGEDTQPDLLRSRIEALMTSSPSGNRIGELHFYLGLALRAQKLAKHADRVFRRHADLYPDDRFAMASRFHHSSYQFSPYGGGRGSRVVSRGSRGPKVDVADYLKKVNDGTPGPKDPKKAMRAFLATLRS